jgi:hypothetical protein
VCDALLLGTVHDPDETVGLALYSYAPTPHQDVIDDELVSVPFQPLPFRLVQYGHFISTAQHHEDEESTEGEKGSRKQ